MAETKTIGKQIGEMVDREDFDAAMKLIEERQVDIIVAAMRLEATSKRYDSAIAVAGEVLPELRYDENIAKINDTLSFVRERGIEVMIAQATIKKDEENYNAAVDCAIKARDYATANEVDITDRLEVAVGFWYSGDYEGREISERAGESARLYDAFNEVLHLQGANFRIGPVFDDYDEIMSSEVGIYTRGKPKPIEEIEGETTSLREAMNKLNDGSMDSITPDHFEVIAGVYQRKHKC